MTDLDIPAFLRIPATGRKAATPCKNESKSWALPAAATNRKTENTHKHSASFFVLHNFCTGLIEIRGWGRSKWWLGVGHPRPTRPLRPDGRLSARTDSDLKRAATRGETPKPRPAEKCR